MTRSRPASARSRSGAIRTAPSADRRPRSRTSRQARSRVALVRLRVLDGESFGNLEQGRILWADPQLSGSRGDLADGIGITQLKQDAFGRDADDQSGELELVA